MKQPLRQLSIFPDDNQRYSEIEQLVELLLDPVGKAQRHKAVVAIEAMQRRRWLEGVAGIFLARRCYDEATRMHYRRILRTAGLGLVASQCYYDPID
jgi:hypothetical protein